MYKTTKDADQVQNVFFDVFDFAEKLELHVNQSGDRVQLKGFVSFCRKFPTDDQAQLSVDVFRSVKLVLLHRSRVLGLDDKTQLDPTNDRTQFIL
jgi:hypothetical protein